jgi:hypothetical protein
MFQVCRPQEFIPREIEMAETKGREEREKGGMRKAME